jgi:ATP-dependent protease ClpP protease subunit
MTVQIEGIIGLDVTARDVRNQLKDVGDEAEILVNSPGGSVTEGVAIYNAIRDYRRGGGKATARVVGVAASMASYIPLAAESVTVEDNTILMVHEPSMLALGRKSDMERAAGILEGVSQTLARAYAEKTGRNVEDIREMMAEETYLFGEDIVLAGFADKIEPAGDGPETRDEAEALARAQVDAAMHKMGETQEDVTQLAAMLGDMPKAQKQEETPIVDRAIPAAQAEKHEEGVMDLSTLKNEHPDVFAAARDIGVQEERARVAELNDQLAADPDNLKLTEVIKAAIADGKPLAQVQTAINVAIRDGGKLDGENPPTVATTADEGAELTAEDREAAKMMGMTIEEYRKYGGGN